MENKHIFRIISDISSSSKQTVFSVKTDIHKSAVINVKISAHCPSLCSFRFQLGAELKLRVLIFSIKNKNNVQRKK